MEIAIIPRWIINKLSSDFIRQNDINILLSNLLVVLVFLIFKNNLINFLNHIPHFCLFNKLVGIECPVCGCTRAFCELSKWNFLNALELNYSSLFIGIFIIFQILLRSLSLIIKGLTVKINKLSKFAGYALVALILINWITKMHFI